MWGGHRGSDSRGVCYTLVAFPRCFAGGRHVANPRRSSAGKVSLNLPCTVLSGRWNKSLQNQRPPPYSIATLPSINLIPGSSPDSGGICLPRRQPKPHHASMAAAKAKAICHASTRVMMLSMSHQNGRRENPHLPGKALLTPRNTSHAGRLMTAPKADPPTPMASRQSWLFGRVRPPAPPWSSQTCA